MSRSLGAKQEMSNFSSVSLALGGPSMMSDCELTTAICRWHSKSMTYISFSGACGEWNVASDFIVALNSAQYGGGYPGPHCFKQITMTYNGKTTTATIMDECPGCPYGGLDLSRGLFKFFASESVGVLSGTWYFNDGSSDDGDNPPPPPPPPPPKTSKYVAPTTSTRHTTKTTPAWTPDPTIYWTPDPTTTTSKKSTTSTSHTSSSTSTSYSSSAASSSSLKHPSSTSSVHATSSSATPSATPLSTDGGHNLAALAQSFLDLGVLVVAAA
ncbi:hypothetical protein C0995_007917 [Termitomyces sp. Mi166|nr:hypothetical protein C0995_007917 [Termitomyces sp. Mi166\